MMTLPNRANYIVERKAEGGEHSFPKPHETHSNYSQPNPNGFPFQPPSMDPKHQELVKSTHDTHEQDSPLRGSGSNKNVNVNSVSPNSNTITTSSNSNNNNNNNNNSTSYDYRNNSTERLSQEDIIEKKNYVQKHRLQQHMLQIVEYCRNEGIIPNLPASLYTPPQQQTDYSLNEFLETQGIECPEDDSNVSKEDDEFTFKLVQLKSAYNEELEKLNRVCNDFISKLQDVLQDQAKVSRKWGWGERLN